MSTVLARPRAILLAIAFFLSCGNAAGADRLANWDGTTGNWSDSIKWLITPEPNDPGVVPNNGNGGFTYDVDIDTGGVTLDINAEIEHLLVGNPDGSGRLTISDARTLETNAGAELGDSTLVGVVRRGTGTVNVTGVGSTWNNTGSISLGSFGTGNLNVIDGGMVNSTSLFAGSGTSIVSPTLRGTGNVKVTGYGSSLTMTSVLNVGNSLGFGNLTVDSLVNVSAPSLDIGTRGSLRVEFGSSPPPVAPLNATGTATLAGTLRVNFPERPMAGVYRILDYQQLTGQFSSIAIENLASSEYSLNYGDATNDSVSLTVTPKPKTASSIFWTDSQNNRVVRANLDGSALQTIVAGLASPLGIDVDSIGHQIYWGSSTQLQQADLDGSDVQNVTNSSADGDIAVDHDGGKIYWTNPFSFNAIKRSNLDGSSIETILTGSGVRGIELDVTAEKIYWTNYLSNTVNRANLDGSEQETLVSGQSNPMNIALDTANGRMYWSDNGFQQIRSANLDGSDIQAIVNVSSGSGSIDIAIDGLGSVYWTQSDSQGTLAQIMRANLDGSSIQTVVQTSNTLIRGLAMVVFDTVPGDFNGDGVVDAADYVLWRKNDRTPEGYNAWRANFGRMLGSSSITNTPESLANVPEPAAAALMASGIIAWLLVRRIRRSAA